MSKKNNKHEPSIDSMENTIFVLESQLKEETRKRKIAEYVVMQMGEMLVKKITQLEIDKYSEEAAKIIL